MASSYTILYAPQLEEMAQALAAALGATCTVCTSNLANCPPGSKEVAVFWDTFPGSSSEKDPNIKVQISALADRDVILLISQDDTSSAFAQLSLLLQLQRFIVPEPAPMHAKGKWKTSVAEGAYTICSVRSLRVIIPWYRYCQMERSCRWHRGDQSDKPWENQVPDGGWVDVATAHTYAALLSAEPPAPPKERVLPLKEILLLDLHDDLHGKPVLEPTLACSGRWANPIREYDLSTGRGTYFASVFYDFLKSPIFRGTLPEMSKVFVVFPDVGAFRRFHAMVHACLDGLSSEHILFIEKSRVGTQVRGQTPWASAGAPHNATS
jgi:hypothetical protein